MGLRNGDDGMLCDIRWSVSRRESSMTKVEAGPVSVLQGGDGGRAESSVPGRHNVSEVVVSVRNEGGV